VTGNILAVSGGDNKVTQSDLLVMLRPAYLDIRDSRPRKAVGIVSRKRFGLLHIPRGCMGRNRGTTDKFQVYQENAH